MTSESKIENNIFNEKKMEDLIEHYNDFLVINSKKDPVNYWIEKLDNDELKNEKANYIQFFSMILEELLGYDLEDIEYEENIGLEGRPVEFTLKKDDKDYVVVELKGTPCKDLNKRYNREQSPIEQVTNYASIKEETQWAIVSNYDEFRLFNPSFREKYISFRFKQLQDPSVLKKFLLVFSKFSLIEKDIPQTLLKESRLIERELEDEFYKLFSETRLMLIKELEHSSDDIDRIETIRLSQLILNRFIFLCFAEDLRLIPSQTTADILLTPIKHKNLFEFTMWDRLNELFRFADKGNEERNISPFNGGLFKEDLRHLEIRDKIEDLSFFDDCYKKWKFEEKYKEIELDLGSYKYTINPIYKNLLLISSFDFGSELDINILGHIFENSIGDIEELKDETKERRKKDGVFYTPENITDYICRQTIIHYLSINNTSTTVHELISEYENSNSLDKLDEKLKNIKILDMACGSGAFLNKAADILFEIHKALHESKYAKDESLNKFLDNLDRRKEIITNNIYGVDLNEESVEITKLSLFLKLSTTSVVKEGFKLPNLDKNIKCGNSLVDDESIVKSKAFNWKNEYSDVFNDGGFDIIIGNPPYIKENVNRNAFIGLKDSPYYQGKMDIWTFFGCVAIDLIKDNGLIGFIAPNNWITNSGASKFRKKVNEECEIRIFKDFGNYKVFDSASIQTMVYIMKKNNDNEEYLIDYSKLTSDKLENKDKLVHFLNNNDNNEYMTSFNSYYSRRENENSYINFIDEKENNILKKITKENVVYLLKNEVSQGVVCPQDLLNNRGAKKLNLPVNSGVFVLSNREKENLNLPDNELELIKPYYTSNEIKKYLTNENNQYWIIYSKSDINNKINDYPNIKKHLDKFYDIITSSNKPYGLHRARKEEIFKGEKIIVTRKCQTPTFSYADFDSYVSQTFNIIKTDRFNLKKLLGILNSKLIEFWLKNKGKMQGNNYQLDKEPLLNIPIKYEENEITQSIKDNVEKLLESQKTVDEEMKGFDKWVNRTISENSIELGNYYELSYDEFLVELKNNGIKVNSRDTQELIEEEFNKSVSILKPTYKEIENIKIEIDKSVYLLYELSNEEIEIIENNHQ